MMYTKSVQDLVQRSAVAIGALLALFSFFVFAQSAYAGVGLGVSPNFPSPVSIGDSGLSASLTITNNSDGGDGNPVELTSITLIPSCGANSGTTCTLPDPDVFTVNDGSGSSACAGINFSVSEVDVATGKVEFTPSATVELALGQTCDIGFTIDVNMLPTSDSSATAGVQTKQVAEAAAIEVGQQGLDGGGFGTDTTTVTPAESRATTEVHDDTHTDVTNTTIAFGGEIHDMVLVEGAGNITPTGDVDFELYDNLTCDGQLLDTEAGVVLDSNGEAESTPFTPDPGEYSFLVTYHGDGNYTGDTAECEPFTVVDKLLIVKTANTSYDRSWNWTIEKSASQTSLTLADGEAPVEVDYTVEVSAVSADVDHMVSGTITIENPAGNPAAMITDVDDVLDESGTATVDCGVTFPHELAAGATLECTYSSSSDGSDDLNTVTVSTSGDVPGGSATADVNWGDPANEIDECIDVTDDNVNSTVLGTVCASDAPETFNYSVSFGAHPDADVILECGLHEHPNIASFTAVNDENDTGETGSDSVTVDVTIECFEGCTLTQGYWKTHSSYGPAPMDEGPAWPAVGGPDTMFYLSGMSWYDAFWTPPAGGNSYYQLAHQWMAAKLNVENGASVPIEVQEALDDAEALFLLHSPSSLITYATNKSGKTIGKKETVNTLVLSQMTTLAGILASYNEGETGPGHCDMDSYSDVD